METPKTLTSLRFMRMIRDSKSMDSNLQAAQVDIAFRRAVSTSQRRNSDRSEEKNEPKTSRKRLQFNEFYDVINELARKKFAPQNDPALAGLNEEEKETWWTFKMLSEYLFPLLQRHEDRGRTAVTYPPRTPTPNPMTPIGNEELSIRPHQSILDTVDQELLSVEGVYGKAEKISKLEDLDTEIWDDINIEDGPMGYYNFRTLFSLFQMHATQDMQFRGATSHDRSRIAAEVVIAQAVLKIPPVPHGTSWLFHFCKSIEFCMIFCRVLRLIMSSCRRPRMSVLMVAACLA